MIYLVVWFGSVAKFIAGSVEIVPLTLKPQRKSFRTRLNGPLLMESIARHGRLKVSLVSR